jgi:hypothetical protein
MYLSIAVLSAFWAEAIEAFREIRTAVLNAAANLNLKGRASEVKL